MNNDFDFTNGLISIGVNGNLASQWVKRRSKNKLNQRSFNRLLRVINRMSLSPNECIQFALDNSLDDLYMKDVKKHFNIEYISYEEQLKDTRWLEKRKTILKRDNYTCQLCGRKDKTLHVHHLRYIQGLKAWEYSNESLITLCCDCHKKLHKEIKK